MPKLDLFFRAHTTLTGVENKNPAKPSPAPPTWPEYALVWDTETTTDERQELLFGVYQFCRLEDGEYVPQERGLFGRDGLEARALRSLTLYAEKNGLVLHSQSQFIEKVLYPSIRLGGLITGFNAAFDISRVARTWGRGKARRGFVFHLKEWRGKPSRYRPSICVTSLDRKKSFFRLRWCFEKEFTGKGRFLDLRTLAFALTSESHSLKSACKTFGAAAKMEHEPRGRITQKEIAYCAQDVAASLGLLNRLMAEFDTHPIALLPDRAYSPASIAKAYLAAMAIEPPARKFKIPDEINGIAMQAFYAGRAECTIRRTAVPVVYCDFLSEYGTVNTLLKNWEILTAESLTFEDCTAEVQALAESVARDGCLTPEIWPRLRFFARVLPNKDILPVRAQYGSTANIGWNYLTSDRPLWYAGADVITSALLTGKAPRIEKAIRVVPHGAQAGLKPTRLKGQVEIDPTRHDFFKKVIETRAAAKSSNPAPAQFLKMLANAGSYGLFCELNPQELEKPAQLNVFSGETRYSPTSPVCTWEAPGKWYSPIIAALVTAGGHLLLAMLEKMVRDAGGVTLLGDTDSAAIVATEQGGLVSCADGPHRMSYRAPTGTAAIQALSWAQVTEIAERFERLNPYDGVRGLLKLEKENFAPDGTQRQLYGYGISSKRYWLYVIVNGRPIIVRASGHGLGFLYPPFSMEQWERKTRRKWAKEVHPWIYNACDFLFRQELGLRPKLPKWMLQPAVMQVTVTTPNVLEQLRAPGWLRPFNFAFLPLIIADWSCLPPDANPERLCVLMPFTRNLADLYGRPCVNLQDGARFWLYAGDAPNPPGQLTPYTINGILQQYLRHPESKFCTANEEKCTGGTIGLLQRTHVIAGDFHYIGKEANRRWAEGGDVSMVLDDLSPTDVTSREYPPPSGAEDDRQLRVRAKKFSNKALGRETGLSIHTLLSFHAGRKIRSFSRKKIELAIKTLESKNALQE